MHFWFVSINQRECGDPTDAEVSSLTVNAANVTGMLSLFPQMHEFLLLLWMLLSFHFKTESAISPKDAPNVLPLPSLRMQRRMANKADGIEKKNGNCWYRKEKWQFTGVTDRCRRVVAVFSFCPLSPSLVVVPSSQKCL